jgi:Protein of unknown function (DUF4235)
MALSLLNCLTGEYGATGSTAPVSPVERERGRFDPMAGPGPGISGGETGRLPSQMKILYKPFAIIASAIAARLGRSAFRSVWSRIDEAEPPDATVHQATLPKVLVKAVLEAAIMSGVAAAADRASARAFEHLTGYWPGDETAEEED